jgi:hypothetical protein
MIRTPSRSLPATFSGITSTARLVQLTHNSNPFVFQKVFKVTDYFGAQRKFEPKDRALNVDWLVQIQETFEYNHETMYLAVKIMDLYISQLPPNTLVKSAFQLTACVAVFIAAKVEVGTLSMWNISLLF